MEKVMLFVKKIIILALAVLVFLVSVRIFLSQVFILPGYLDFIYLDAPVPTGGEALPGIFILLLAAFSSLVFAFLDYRITGEKPRFLFGMNQSDTFLNKKGGFWNLFKWIVTTLGFLYDMLIWSSWGVFLLFMLVVEVLLLVKTIIYWIIYALIWFIRLLFPPFIFIYRMILHYLVRWNWWIFKSAAEMLKLAIQKNFYIIALWGAIPAVFIVFLFYSLGKYVGIPELVYLSAVFALIPLVWSFGEIAAVRFENKEHEEYGLLRFGFRNGFDVVKSVLVYLLVLVVLVLGEIILNAVAWIPDYSMSVFGLSLNINMALSIILIFLAVILLFSGCILPTHILFYPEHENNLQGSMAFLSVIAKKFLRYLTAHFSAAFFGALLLVIPLALIIGAGYLTDKVKDSIIDAKLERMEGGQDMLRLNFYKDLPFDSGSYLERMQHSGEKLKDLEQEKAGLDSELREREASYNETMSLLDSQDINPDTVAAPEIEGVAGSAPARKLLEEEFEAWRSKQEVKMLMLDDELKAMKQDRVMIPIFYFFAAIFVAIFGGLLLAVLISYLGNLYFELYAMREDRKPSAWCSTLTDLKKKDPNQPLLGFALLGLIAAVVLVVVFVL